MKTDLEMMQSPGDWPRWPILPLKPVSGDFRPGLLVADGHPEVYLVSLYRLKPGKTLGEQFAGVEKLTYVSFEELAKEWRVD